MHYACREIKPLSDVYEAAAKSRAREIAPVEVPRRTSAYGSEPEISTPGPPEPYGGRVPDALCLGRRLTVRYPRFVEGVANEIATKLADQIEKLVQNDGARTVKFLDYWSRNVVPGSGSAIFPAGISLPEQTVQHRIKEYCRFLGTLKLEQEHLCFEGACGTDERFPPTKWYSQWGLTSRGKKFRIRNYPIRKARVIAPGEWLAIGPKAACPKAEEFERPYRDAFCFVMLLASIRFVPCPSLD